MRALVCHLRLKIPNRVVRLFIRFKGSATSGHVDGPPAVVRQTSSVPTVFRRSNSTGSIRIEFLVGRGFAFSCSFSLNCEILFRLVDACHLLASASNRSAPDVQSI